MGNKLTGLMQKYYVKRVDGREKPNAKYFVLDYANDLLARNALWAYAQEARVCGYEALAADLTRAIEIEDSTTDWSEQGFRERYTNRD